MYAVVFRVCSMCSTYPEAADFRFFRLSALFVSVFLIFGTGALFAGGPLSFAAAADSLQAEILADPVSRTVCFVKNGKIVNIRCGSPVVFFNGAPVFPEDPPQKDRPEISAGLLAEMQDFFSGGPAPFAYRVGAILIDPGHGGKDPGAVGTYTENGETVSVREKDVVLSVASTLYEQLRARYPDKRILMTRSGDTYPSLEDRVNLANSVELAKHEAVIYVSIHANAAFNKNSSGFEVWYLSPDYRRTVIDESSVDSEEILPILNSMMEEEFTTESILIAKSILDGLEAQIGAESENRGLKAESWFVVRNARMPSVLIELGFVTNDREVRLLDDPGYLRKCASGIYTGVVNFVSYFERNGGFQSP